MFRRWLTALGHENPSQYDSQNKDDLRKIVVWVEREQIRRYSNEPEKLKTLSKTESEEWSRYFESYLRDMVFDKSEEEDDPMSLRDKVLWLLGFALKIEYKKNAPTLNRFAHELRKQREGQKKPTWADTINLQSDEFKEGVNTLAKELRISRHLNHLVTFEACAKYIGHILNEDNKQRPPSSSTPVSAGKPRKKPKREMNVINLEDHGMGFNEINDPVVRKAAKLLRLLHINELRDLQTRINNVIVEVQVITANPKTDTKLGKVGR